MADRGAAWVGWMKAVTAHARLFPEEMKVRAMQCGGTKEERG